MLGAIEVELVGGDTDWLSIAVAIAGPVLIAGAAVFAAITARKSAVERQEEQLAHDTERQEEALAHDLKRQELALQHDREMRDRESTRIVVDNAMEAANSIIDTFVYYEGAIRRLQVTMNEDGECDPQLLEEAKEKQKQAAASIAELVIHNLRLRTRPDLDDLSEAYRAVRGTYDEHQDALKKGLSAKLSADELAEIEAIDAKGTEKIAALMGKWRLWLSG